MEPTLDSTLGHVLDPALQDAAGAGQHPPTAVQEENAPGEAHVDAQPVPLSDPQPVPQGTTAQDVVSAPHTPAPAPNPATPVSTGRAKKAVDPVRREANRRAAERSRGRQQEKVVALEMAVQALSEENLRLKEELARLEGGEGAAAGPAGGSLDDSSQVAPAAPAEGAPAYDVAAATQAQQDHQSRNILAALLATPGAGNLDEAIAAGLESVGDGDASWMQGVENLFKEAEASGRLSELAAVAAGQGGDEQHTSATSVLGDLLGSGKTGKSALNSAAISAEMEKLLQDDIARTKAATARVERELARLRGEPVFGGEDDDEPFVPVHTELAALADDDAVRDHADKTQKEIVQLEIQAGVLREVVARMATATAEEEKKLAAAAAELRAFSDYEDAQRDRDGVTAVLRALRGQVTAMINAPGGYQPGNTLATPFSSPATARRRRGRPPKHSAPASSAKLPYTYFASPTASDSGSELPETPTAPQRTRAAAPRRSRLAHELRLTPEQAEAGPSFNGTSAGGDVGNAEAASAVSAEANQATTDYLLSHFTESNDDSRDAPLQLDSSSFAAFLPQSPPGQVHSALEPPALEHAQQPPASVGEADAAAAAAVAAANHNAAAEQPHVLSRFKRGPPGSCDICSRTQTSVWRKLSYDGEDLRVCNACGLYHSKFGIPRPPELWGDGRTIKKRKAGPRNWEGIKRRREARKSASGMEDGKFDDDEVAAAATVAHVAQQVQHELGSSVAAAAAAAAVDGADGAAGTPNAEAPDVPTQATLHDVGRAVENMFAVQQQQHEQGEGVEPGHEREVQAVQE